MDYIFKIYDPDEYNLIFKRYERPENIIKIYEGLVSTSSSSSSSEDYSVSYSSDSSSSSSSYWESVLCIQVTGFGEGSGLYQYNGEINGHHSWVNGSYILKWFTIGFTGLWVIDGGSGFAYALDGDTEYPEGNTWQQVGGSSPVGFTFATECYPATSSSTSSSSSESSTSSLSSTSDSSYSYDDQCYCVDGFGSSVVNGLYSFIGIINGKPAYANGGISLIRWISSEWRIEYFNGVLLETYYISTDASITPPNSGWSYVNGLEPIGTVELCDCYPSSSSSSSSFSSTSSTSSESSSYSSYSSYSSESTQSSASTYSSASSYSTQSDNSSSSSTQSSTSSSSSIDSSSSTSSESQDVRDIYLEIDADECSIRTCGKALRNINLASNNRLVITKSNDDIFDEEIRLVLSWNGQHITTIDLDNLDNYTKLGDLNFDESSLDAIFSDKGNPESALITMSIYRYQNQEYHYIATGLLERV